MLYAVCLEFESLGAGIGYVIGSANGLETLAVDRQA